MPTLKLTVFGSPQIELNGTPVQLTTRKALALLAYVAVNNQAQSREKLAALFWPDFSSNRAFANLRETLRSLKQALTDHWLDIRRYDVAIRSDSTLSVDVLEFQQLLEQSRNHPHAPNIACAGCVPLLIRAIDLYRDDFLQGFTLPDCPAFDEWQAFQTDLFREKLLESSTKVMQYYRSCHDFPAALGHARRWVNLCPWTETAHRELMRLYALNQERSKALQQYQECQRILREEFGTEPEHQTTELYEAILHEKELTPRPPLLKREGEHIFPSPPRSGGEVVSPPHNLPAQTTTFIGRKTEAAEVQELLCRPEVRLLTLTGAGGTGKTRLGLHVAAKLLKNYADGVFFVSLSPISEPDLAAPAIVQALGLYMTGSTAPGEVLKGYLQQKHLLLLLDNFEQILPAAPLLIDLLAAAPHVRMLVTSRTVLRVSGEHEFIVPPLKVPAVNALPSFEWLTQSEAVQLFVERAKAVNRNFGLTEENALAVGGICTKLEGLPLSIELAAARIRLLPPDALLSRLEHPLQFLVGGARDRPARQQTLRKTIEWSHNLLDADEQTLFCRLAVFVGGWTLEAAEAICAVDGDLDVLTGMEALVDHNMLVQEKTTRELRFGMLETLREYALERFEASENVEIIRKQHAQFFMLFGQEANAHLNTMPLENHVMWRERLTRDLDNLRAALSRALEHAEAGRQTVTELHETLGDLLEFTGQHVEARKIYQETVPDIPENDKLWQARLHRKLGKTWEVLNCYKEASHCYDAAESALNTERTETMPDWRQARIDLQVDRIWLHYWQNHVDEMTLLAESVQPIIEQDGTPGQRARFFNGLTLMGYKQERYLLSSGTIAHSLSAVSASRKSDSLNVRSMSQFLLGFSYLWGDVLEKAEVPLQAALKLAEDIGDVVLQSRCLTYLIVVYRCLGRLEHVRAFIPQSIDVAKTAQLHEYIGMAKANLAWVALQEENVAEVENNGHAALDIWRQLHPYHSSFKWTALWPLIAIRLSEDRTSEAIECVQTMLDPNQKRLPDALAGALESTLHFWDTRDEKSVRSQLTHAMKLAQGLHHF